LIEGTEECDDGALASGDGCSSACNVEPFFYMHWCSERLYI
jgi:cysteine-rich repeat protein